MYSLDIIRGLAAVCVFLTHLGISATESKFFDAIVNYFIELQYLLLWCNGGLHWAVIVFIVLSGFCIHMPQAKSGVTSVVLPEYMRRRFYRIYPPLVVATFFGVVVYSIINTFDYSYILKMMAALSLLPGVTDAVSPPLGNEILTTVIVECLLYACYPFLIPKIKAHWNYVLLAGLCIYCTNFSLLFITEIDVVWLQRNIFALFIYWWLGAFFAELAFNNRHWKIECSVKKIAALMLVTYLVYITGSYVVNFKGAHVFKSLYLSILTGVFLFGLTRMESKKAYIGKTVKFMTGVGEHAYSLYIVHLPIILLLSYLVMDSVYENTVLFYFSNITAVIVCTLLFYRFIEMPSHRYAKISSNLALPRS